MIVQFSRSKDEGVLALEAEGGDDSGVLVKIFESLPADSGAWLGVSRFPDGHSSSRLELYWSSLKDGR